MFQDSSLDFKLVQRICLLQQALDQATESLEEMQQQVANHQMLQAHLAQTEEYSNVQQKIILNLQHQLATKDKWQQQVLEKILVGIKHLVEDQQVELERLRVRIYQSQTEVQEYLVQIKNHYQSLSVSQNSDLDLNSEVMIARSLSVSLSSQLHTAQQHIQQLDTTLTRHQVTLARLQVYAHTLGDSGVDPLPLLESERQPGCRAELATDWDTLDDPLTLRAIIEAQQQKIDELSAELGHQFHQQTSLKTRCQKIAAERDRLKQQELALRLENESLQAQLAQADQPSTQGRSPQPTQPKIHAWQATSKQPNPLARLRRPG